MPAGGQRARMLAAARAARKPVRRRRWRVSGQVGARGRAALRGRWRALSPRRRFVAGGGAAGLVVLLAGLLTWVSLGGGAAPRARQYLAFTACLLTDSQGLAATQTALVWHGMQDASLATRAKVEYLPVMSGSTAAAAAPYLESLLQRHCNVVVATGPAQVAAVKAQATRFPSVRFVVIGHAAAGSHVTAVEAPAGKVREDVAGLITADVHDYQ